MGKEAPVISLAGASSFSPLLALIRFLFYPHFNQHPVPVKQQNSRFLFLRDIPACRPTKHEKAPELPGLFASTKSAGVSHAGCSSGTSWSSSRRFWWVSHAALQTVGFIRGPGDAFVLGGLVDSSPSGSIMNGMDGNEQRRLSSKQYETFAQWLERIAILFLASFVVQSIVRGSSLRDPVVIVGTLAALVAYYGAARLRHG